MAALDRELHGQGGHENITLTTVCPLSISTGMFAKPRSKFEAIFPICNAEYVAAQAIDAILLDKSLVCVPWTGELFHRVSQLAPIRVQKLVQDFFAYGVDAH